jgi:hypothetical protein
MALDTYPPRTYAQGKDGCGRQAGMHPGQRRRRAGLLVSGPRRFEQRPSGAQPWMVNCHVAPCPRRRERARGVARWVVGSYPPAAGGGGAPHKRGARSPLGRGVILGLRHHPIPSHPAPDDTLNSSVCAAASTNTYYLSSPNPPAPHRSNTRRPRINLALGPCGNRARSTDTPSPFTRPTSRPRARHKASARPVFFCPAAPPTTRAPTLLLV